MITESIRVRIVPAGRRVRHIQEGIHRHDSIAGSPPGPLHAFEDVVLGAGQEQSLTVDTDSLLCVLPLAGGICYEGGDRSGTLGPGEWLQVPLRAGASLKVFNPYEQEAVNYLLVRASCPTAMDAVHLLPFSVGATGAGFQSLGTAILSRGSGQGYLTAAIGRFDGRQELSWQVRTPGSALFAFVIEGAVEVQHRLLETRDALLLQDCSRLEAEALSHGALLLLLELSPANA